MNEEELLRLIAELQRQNATESEIRQVVQAASAPGRETIARAPSRAASAIERTKQRVLGGAATALNTLAAGAFPQIVGGVRYAIEGLRPGAQDRAGAYTRGVEDTRQFLGTHAQEYPRETTLEKGAGFAAQVALPLSRGLGLAGTGAVASGIYGGLAGIANTSSDATPGDIAKAAMEVGVPSAVVGGPLGYLGGRGLKAASDATARMVRGARGVSIGGPFAGSPATVPRVPPSSISAHARGQGAVQDAIVRRGTDLTEGIAERAALDPEVLRHTPILAHMGPEEMHSVWAPATSVRHIKPENDLRFARGIEKNLQGLHRVMQRAGDVMDEVLTPIVNGRKSRVLLPQGSTIPQYLATEAADSPIVMDAILDAADVVSSTGVGRAAGYTTAEANALRRAMQANGDTPQQINAAIAREIRDANWSLEALAEIRRSVGRVASRGLQPGATNSTFADRLNEFNRGVVQRLSQAPEVGANGPRLEAALNRYRQAQDMTHNIVTRTGAQPLTRSTGAVRPGRWQLPAFTKEGGIISTPAARFVGDAIVPGSVLGGTAIPISSAGLTAGTIAGLRRGQVYLREQTAEAGAQLMARTGSRGSDLLQSFQRNTRLGQTPPPPSALQRAGARAGGALVPNYLASPQRPAGGGIPALLSSGRPYDLTEEEKQQLGPFDPRRFIR